MLTNYKECEKIEKNIDDFLETYGEPNKQTITVDYLTISFNKQLPDYEEIQRKSLENGRYVISNDCFLIHLNSSLNGFNNAANLFIKNQYIGKLLYNPIENIDRNTVHLILENSLFYINTFVQYIDYLIYDLNFHYNHLVRLDIANDFIKHNIFDFYEKFNKSDNIKLKGKSDTIEKKRKKKIICLVMGSTNSDKRLSIYNKSNELIKNSKQYIYDFWNFNKLDYINNNVERVELRLKTRFLHDVNYKELDNPNYLISLSKLHLKNYFEFESRYKINNKYITKNVTPFDVSFSDYVTIPMKKVNKSKPSTNLFSAKIQLKRLYFNVLLESLLYDNETDLQQLNPEHLDNSKLTIDRYLVLYPDLVNYYNRKIKTWDVEFREKNINSYCNVDKMVKDSITLNDIDTFTNIEKVTDTVIETFLNPKHYLLESNLVNKISDSNLDIIHKHYLNEMQLNNCEDIDQLFKTYLNMIIAMSIIDNKTNSIININEYIYNLNNVSSDIVHDKILQLSDYLRANKVRAFNYVDNL